MSLPAPGLYVGTLRHARSRPRAHVFTYPAFLALLDIDRIPALMAASRLTAYNRPAWASYHERDHFGDPSRPLRARVEADAAAAGVDLPGGPIYLLTNLRYLGYCFNPVSFYYCHDPDGQLQLVLAEVNNTFGETHNYWLTPAVERAGEGGASPGVRRYALAKVFHVSPFLPLDLRYAFALTPPAERLAVQIDVLDRDGVVLGATLALARRPWSAREIRRVLVRFPWTTAKTVAAIHYQALRLFLKGVAFFPHPGSPPSLGRPRSGTRTEQSAWPPSSIGSHGTS